MGKKEQQLSQTLGRAIILWGTIQKNGYKTIYRKQQLKQRD
jgi:hypothetical protein